MRHLALRFVALALPFWSVPLAHAQSAHRPAERPITQRHFDNGLTVVVQEDHRAPLVALQLLFEGGERQSPAGEEGVATMTMYMFGAGTKHVAPDEYDALLARAGARDVTNTTWESGARVTATVPARHLALPLWLWSDEMGFFPRKLDEGRFRGQQRHLHEQRSSAMSATPTARVDAVAAQELDPGGRLGRVSYLTPEAIDAVSSEAVVAYHDHWITPSHATLVMVGDFQASEALALVDKYFGAIPSGPSDHVPFPTPPTLPGETQIDFAARTTNARVSLNWPTPRIFTTDDARLDLVAHLLSGLGTAWLYWKLVDDLKVASHVSARQRSGYLDSTFTIDIEGVPGRSAAELLQAYDSAMVELRSRRATATQIEEAQYELLMNRVLRLEEPNDRAGEMARWTRLVGDPGYVRHDLDRYTATPAEVAQAMDRWLPADRRVVVLVTPTPGAPPGGEKRGQRLTAARVP